MRMQAMISGRLTDAGMSQERFVLCQPTVMRTPMQRHDLVTFLKVFRHEIRLDVSGRTVSHQR